MDCYLDACLKNCVWTLTMNHTFYLFMEQSWIICFSNFNEIPKNIPSDGKYIFAEWYQVIRCKVKSVVYLCFFRMVYNVPFLSLSSYLLNQIGSNLDMLVLDMFYIPGWCPSLDFQNLRECKLHGKNMVNRKCTFKWFFGLP